MEKATPLNIVQDFLCVAIQEIHTGTILPAKSDSDVIFVHKIMRDFESIDHLCNNSILRIRLIHMMDQLCINSILRI